MPERTYKCDQGHITRQIRSINDAPDNIPCPECGLPADWFLEGSAPGFNSPASRIWLGSEVDGKRYGSDEWRTDIEKAACPPDPVPKDVRDAFEKTRSGVNR